MKLSKIYCGDSQQMNYVSDNSIQLIVTSPPYNVGKQYDHYQDEKDFQDYLEMLNNVWIECRRVLCIGGRIAINVANTNRSPYIPLSSIITNQILKLGFLMRGEVIWNKGASAGVSTAWGSFARASNPVLRDVHEYIMIFSKGEFRLSTNGNGSGISNQDFVNWTRSIWDFPTESKKNGSHPTPYPVELPHRLILLYTNIGDTVLDPFIGSGTTAVAAKKLGRNYIGYDISEEYCNLANHRLSRIQKSQDELDRLILNA